MKATARIKMKLPSTKIAEDIFNALEPETKTSTFRSRADLKKEDATLVLNVEAKDTVALRASLNAYLRWICSLLNVFHVLTDFS